MHFKHWKIIFVALLLQRTSGVFAVMPASGSLSDGFSYVDFLQNVRELCKTNAEPDLGLNVRAEYASYWAKVDLSCASVDTLLRISYPELVARQENFLYTALSYPFKDVKKVETLEGFTKIIFGQIEDNACQFNDLVEIRDGQALCVKIDGNRLSPDKIFRATLQMLAIGQYKLLIDKVQNGTAILLIDPRLVLSRRYVINQGASGRTRFGQMMLRSCETNELGLKAQEKFRCSVLLEGDLDANDFSLQIDAVDFSYEITRDAKIKVKMKKNADTLDFFLRVDGSSDAAR